MSKDLSLIEKNEVKLQQLHNEQFQLWLNHILFTWRWWLGVMMILVCIGVWIWLWKKKSAGRLMYVVCFTAFLATFLDSLGNFFGLWAYRYEVVPFYTYLPWDVFMLPTVILLLLLYKSNLNPLWKALFLGALTTFVGLPLMTWLGIYEPKHWRFIYSFPIQMVIYLLAHFISRRNKFHPIKD